MKHPFSHILIAVILTSLASCSQEVSQDELIKAAVTLKMEQWRKAEINRCEEEAYTQASDYVDSLLVAMSLDTKLDTIPKPAKPEKPPKPEFKLKPDSVIIDPLLHEDQ